MRNEIEALRSIEHLANTLITDDGFWLTQGQALSKIEEIAAGVLSGMSQECNHKWERWSLRGRGNLLRHGEVQYVNVCNQCEEVRPWLPVPQGTGT